MSNLSKLLIAIYNRFYSDKNSRRDWREFDFYKEID